MLVHIVDPGLSRQGQLYNYFLLSKDDPEPSCQFKGDIALFQGQIIAVSSLLDWGVAGKQLASDIVFHVCLNAIGFYVRYGKA